MAFSALISFYYLDGTFSTSISFFCRDKTSADPIDLLRLWGGEYIPALFRLPVGDLPGSRVCKVESVDFSSFLNGVCNFGRLLS